MTYKPKFVRCEICQGGGWIRGVFHQLECAGCNGGGFVHAGSNAALSYSELVKELRRRSERPQVMRGQSMGPEQIYLDPNTKGAGGSNYTGD